MEHPDVSLKSILILCNKGIMRLLCPYELPVANKTLLPTLCFMFEMSINVFNDLCINELYQHLWTLQNPEQIF